MGWEQFKGHTERVDLSKAGSGAGNFAKAFGDAFSTIGNDMINAKAQAKKDELLGLQIQNEQAKLDAAKDAKAVKKVDDAFRNDAGTLDLNVTAEAKQNAMDALKQFYNPSLEARTAQDQANSAKEAVIQKQNDDTYKGMVLNSPNKQELADAWAMSDLGDRGYKPSADIIKERDNFFQGKFNDEAISVANSGNYKNMDEYVKANPELVKNADGVTMAKIDQYFSGKVKDAFDRTDKDRTYKLSEKKFDHEVSHDNKTLQIAKMKAENGGDGGTSAGEKDSKVVDAINKITATKFGKADNMGGITIDPAKANIANYLNTKALLYASKGMSASQAWVAAEKYFNDNVVVGSNGELLNKKVMNTKLKQDNPLDIPNYNK